MYLQQKPEIHLISFVIYNQQGDRPPTVIPHLSFGFSPLDGQNMFHVILRKFKEQFMFIFASQSNIILYIEFYNKRIFSRVFNASFLKLIYLAPFSYFLRFFLYFFPSFQSFFYCFLLSSSTSFISSFLGFFLSFVFFWQ